VQHFLVSANVGLDQTHHQVYKEVSIVFMRNICVNF